MITKQEILSAATQMSLTPHVVEKDYVLGWVLAGINAHPVLRESWVFKGGTCLKKCYFETYRFSEDLDFTLRDAAHLEQGFLQDALAQVGAWVYEQTGIEVPADRQEFDIYTNLRGNVSCQGKLSYRGPVSPRDMPRIKLDLTADECLVLPPVRVPVFHPYSDAPQEPIEAFAYAYEEVFAEKTRALAERTRPRDLYDVINLFRNEAARPPPAIMCDVLQQKCDFKGIGFPAMGDLEQHRAELENLWTNMLAHQLPMLPPYQAFWDELPAFFEWLLGGAAPEMPAAFVIGAGETVLRARSLDLGMGTATLSTIEIIRFAAANRLLVELTYDGSVRRIEPYSLRRTRDSNVLLHAFNVDRGQHRSYRIDRIGGARVTNQSFVPRYEIELTPQGPLHIAPAAARASTPISKPALRHTAGFGQPRQPAKRKVATFGSSPTYVYRCTVCQKKFRRTSMDARLNPHKNDWGGQCMGRTGFLEEVKY